MVSAGAGLSLLAASVLAATGLSEPHAAAEVFDQDYPTSAACEAALEHGREAGTPELRRLLDQAECHAKTERDGVRFHVRIRWKRSPVHHIHEP